MRKVFLRLDEIGGAPPGERRTVEIEVSSFYWNEHPPRAGARGRQRGHAAKDGLTVFKRSASEAVDPPIAALTGQSFRGLLTLEDFSASETLVRSIVFELPAVFVRSVLEIKNGEVINLSCRSIKLLRMTKGRDSFLRESVRWFRRAVSRKSNNRRQII